VAGTKDSLLCSINKQVQPTCTIFKSQTTN
jgi:hypothetical protein